MGSAAPIATAPDASPPTRPDDEPEDQPVELAVLRNFQGIDIVETSNHHRHEHGGAPAKVGSLAINFEVRDRRAHEIVVRKAELLRAHCREDGWHDRTPLQLREHDLYAWDSYDPITSGAAAMIPAGEPRRVQVKVRFPIIEVYQACDRFGFGLELTIDRVPVSIELPLAVVRFEPIRRPVP